MDENFLRGKRPADPPDHRSDLEAARIRVADAFARASGSPDRRHRQLGELSTDHTIGTQDIVDRLAHIASAYPAGQHTATDAITEITRLRLQLWEARKGSVLLHLEQEEVHADRLADALRGLLDYGAVGNGDGYAALADHQRRRGM